MYSFVVSSVITRHNETFEGKEVLQVLPRASCLQNQLRLHDFNKWYCELCCTETSKIPEYYFHSLPVSPAGAIALSLSVCRLDTRRKALLTSSANVRVKYLGNDECINGADLHRHAFTTGVEHPWCNFMTNVSIIS
jgi:hypothetical protein